MNTFTFSCAHADWYWSETWLTWKCKSCGQRRCDVEAFSQREIDLYALPPPKICMTCGELLYPVEKMSGIQWNHETTELAWHCQELLDAQYLESEAEYYATHDDKGNPI